MSHPMSEPDDPVKRAAELVHEISSGSTPQKVANLMEVVDEVKKAVSALELRLQKIESQDASPDPLVGL
jgi:ubiquinone biosynthesis protein UbiJ